MMDALVCPICGAGFEAGPRSVCCPAGHSFDIARQGYVNLLPGDAATGTADTGEMVAAREAFLGAGHFRALAELVADQATRLCDDGLVVDAGAGVGYYLTEVLNRVPAASGLALDLSKFAARRAAKAHPRITATVADVWRRWPVRSASADLVLDVFAPRNGAEFGRVLRPGGALLVVTPTERHLHQVRAGLGLLAVDGRKSQRLDSHLGGHFTRSHADEHEFELALAADALEHLVRMGPSAHHLAASEVRDRIEALVLPFRVTVSFTLSVYRAG